MPFGLGLGEVIALVRETRRLETATAQISVSGPGAHELALRANAHRAGRG